MVSRRELVLLATTAAIAPRLCLAARLAAVAGRIYIGTGNTGPGAGMMTASWDARTGAIGEPTLAAELDSPTFLAQFRQRTGETLVYAVSEVSGPGATVSAYTTTAGETTLKLLNRVSTKGDGPTHLSVSPDGRTVLVANYGGGSVSSFRVAANGSLSEAISHIQFSGSSVYKDRQDASHAHSAMTSPDGRFVLVNDLGLDRIFIFHLDPATSRMVQANLSFWSARPGSGPRHIAWHPNGRYVYCSNELDSTVETLAWSEHPVSLRSLGHASTLPADFAPNRAFVGEVLASADGRNVYVGNRVADDTIAVFTVARKTGLLLSTQFAPTGGINCRHLAFDPSGRWLVAAHQNSNDLSVLQRESATGRLSVPVQQVKITKPMCVIFV